MGRTLLIVVMVVLSAATNSAWAQSQSLFTGSSTSNSARSSGSSSGSSMQSSGTSGLTGGMQGSGMGGLGGGGAGGGTGSSGAFGGPTLNDLGSLSSQSVGRGTGFVGQGGQNGFVGNRLGGTTGARMMQPSFGSRGGGAGGGGPADFNNQDQSQFGATQQRPFRPRYRIGFEYKPAAANIAQRVAVHANRLTIRNPAFAGLDIRVNDDGVAEIRGQAPTDEARRLIENVVRLEPGVRSINNLVEVAPTAAPAPAQ